MGHITGYDHEHEHAHMHTHEHEHEDGTVHTHKHVHEGEHEHSHEEQSLDETQLRALLNYMIHHNEHHAEELVNLQDSLPEKARKKLLLAVGTFEAANVQLQQVLDELDTLD